jgi:PEP-CTERM motif
MSYYMMRKVVIHAAAAAATAALPAAAIADTVASSSLSNMRFTLIDLRPNDGIAPQVTFDSATLNGKRSYVQGSALDTFHGGFDYQSYERSGNSAFGPAAGARDGARAGSNAAVIGGSGTQQPGLSASGYTKGGLSTRDNAFNAWAYVSDAPLEFTLTPHTRLVWSADYEMETQTTHGRWNANDGTEHAFARATMGLYDANSHTLDEADHWQQATFSGNSGQDVHHAGLLSVSFDNRSNHSFDGSMAAYTGVYGEVTGNVGSVPEPATNAMLLAGLAMVGTVVHRRRRKA